MTNKSCKFRMLNKTGVISLPRTGFKALVKPEFHISKDVLFQQLNSMVLPKGSPLMVRIYYISKLYEQNIFLSVTILWCFFLDARYWNSTEVNGHRILQCLWQRASNTVYGDRTSKKSTTATRKYDLCLPGPRPWWISLPHCLHFGGSYLGEVWHDMLPLLKGCVLTDGIAFTCM